jgi:tetrahydromethanopterin S-methyltransferase subunit G
MLLPAYLNHDRLLMQVVTNQDSISKRLDKIEEKLERHER